MDNFGITKCTFCPTTPNFMTKNCCKDNFHILMFLENCLLKNIVPEKMIIREFFSNQWPKIRLLAVKVYLKHFGYDGSVDFVQNDPFYRIRLLSVSWISLSQLLKMIEDENVGVKLAVLNEIYLRNITPDDYNATLNKIGKCMVHPDVEVRCLTSRLLRKFVNLDTNTLDFMLSKKDEDVKTKNICGLVVYGLEDEFYEVRRNTIESLYLISRPESIPAIFECFVDTLNDESLEVRKRTADCISKLSISHKIQINLENVEQICHLLKEKNSKLVRNIIRALSNLRYENFECVEEIIKNISLSCETKVIQNILVNVYKNNQKLIIDNLNAIYNFTPFLEENNLLTDSNYFCKVLLVSLCVLNGTEMHLDKTTKKHVRFFIQELSTSTPLDNQNLIDYTKDCLSSYIERPQTRFKIEKMLRNQKQAPDFLRFIRFLIYLYKTENYKSRLLSLNFHFTNVNLTESIVECDGNLIEHCYSLNFNAIRRIKNKIIIKRKPNIRQNSMIDFEFEISTPFKHAIFVLEQEDGKQMKFKVQKLLKFSFYNEKSLKFKCFLQVTENQETFIISKKMLLESSEV